MQFQQCYLCLPLLHLPQSVLVTRNGSAGVLAPSSQTTSVAPPQFDDSGARDSSLTSSTGWASTASPRSSAGSSSHSQLPGRQDTSTSCRTPDNPEQELTEGLTVIVSEDFVSNSNNQVQLKKGLRGRILEIDEDGDAEIDFNGLPTSHVVLKENFSKLGPEEEEVEEGKELFAASDREICTSVSRMPTPVSCSLDPKIAAAPRRKVVSLFAANRCGFLPQTELHPAETIAQWLSWDVMYLEECVSRQKGVVDLLAADHINASFGAARVCGAHRQAAVRCALSAAPSDRPAYFTKAQAAACPALVALRSTSAVAAGPALCGDFGSDALQRYMVIGGVSSLAAVVERVAARWRASPLVDAAVYADVKTDWDCRLRGEAAYPKRGAEQPFFVWEVVGEKLETDDEQQGAESVHAGEWMYSV
eukprot:gene15016-biopygen9636